MWLNEKNKKRQKYCVIKKVPLKLKREFYKIVVRLAITFKFEY